MNRPSQEEITYMQIDGESVKIKNLRSVEIRRSKIVEGGKIKVLIPSWLIYLNDDEIYDVIIQV